MLARCLIPLLLLGCVPEGRTTIVPEPMTPDPNDPMDGDPNAGRDPSDGMTGDDDDIPPAGMNEDPNALRFSRDILPILEAHCTECHDEGRAYDFTKLPLGPAGAGPTVEIMLAAAASAMPPSPREKLSNDELQMIRTWKAQGLLP